jgi:hypothetical protein
LKGLWERDFDDTKDPKGLLNTFDTLKERYKNMRDELCHNHYQCFTDTQNTKMIKGKRHVASETEYLTGKNALSYLLDVLKIIK